MARFMDLDTDKIYRAVIVRELPANDWRDGFTSTEVYGPYTTAGPAEREVSKAKNENKVRAQRWPDLPPIPTEAHVEVAELDWQRYEK